MIKVVCRTNLDYYDCSKVEYMSCRPQLGDLVAVTKVGRAAFLKIVGIAHNQSGVGHNTRPYLDIELHHVETKIN